MLSLAHTLTHSHRHMHKQTNMHARTHSLTFIHTALQRSALLYGAVRCAVLCGTCDEQSPSPPFISVARSHISTSFFLHIHIYTLCICTLYNKIQYATHTASSQRSVCHTEIIASARYKYDSWFFLFIHARFHTESANEQSHTMFHRYFVFSFLSAKHFCTP